MKKLLGIAASLALLGPAGMAWTDQAGIPNLNKNNVPGALGKMNIPNGNGSGAGLGKGSPGITTGAGALAKGKGTSNYNLVPKTSKIKKVQTRPGNNPGRGVTTGGSTATGGNQVDMLKAGSDLAKPKVEPVTSGSWNPNNNKPKPKNGPATNAANPNNHSDNPAGGPATGGGNPLGESSSN